MRPAEMKKKI